MTGLDEHKLGTLLKVAVPEPEASVDLAARARELAVRHRRRRAAVAGSLAVVIVVLVPVLVLSLRPGGGPGPTGPATGPSTHTAPTPDSALCGRACNARHVVEAIRRPLHLPTVAGGSCPVSTVRHHPGGAGFTGRIRALGSGPLLMTGVPPSGRIQVKPGTSRGWLETKVIWEFGKDYGGPLLLHGARIDGPGRLRFDDYLGTAGYSGYGPGTGPHRQVLYVRGGLRASAPHEIESEPDVLYVDRPGCYAIQADGVGLSRVLVFRAVRG